MLVTDKDYDISSIEEMIKSKDREARYLGVSIIRNNPDLFYYHNNLIKQVSIIERIHNFNDILLESRKVEESILLFENPKNNQEKSLNAINKLFEIALVYNEDSLFPNMDDTSQYKYFPYFRKENGSWLVDAVSGWDPGSLLPGGFYYNTEEKALDSTEKFMDIYNDYLM